MNTRRKFLRNSLLGLSAGLGATVAARAADMCILTPQQTSGPFYPEQGITNRLDLTQIEGRPAAEGLKFWMVGQVQDENCQPIEGAIVEIWQACASGKYAHANDPNPAPLDPNFLYSGKVMTKTDGCYEIKTVKPGAYPAAPGWVRPPHIHFKVSAFGYETLVSQLYFAGEDELNSRDRILQQIPESQQEAVIASLTREFLRGLILPFDITLKKPSP